MTYKQWEAELNKSLSALPDDEKKNAIDYYREIYADKSEAGISDSDIIADFGSPQAVALRILNESAMESDPPSLDEGRKSEENLTRVRNEGKKITVSTIIGYACLILFVGIPAAVIMISLIASFGAATIGCGAGFIGGIIGAAASPFGMILGYTGLNALATAGASLAVSGASLILLIVFYYITKYVTVTSYKITVYAIKGRRSA